MLSVKICGLRDIASVTAAVEGGAAFVGFVFYRKSPRFIAPEHAAALVAALPEHIRSVGLFVDPTDEEIESVLSHVPLDYLQLHGDETPERVRDIKIKSGQAIIKAVGISAPMDLERAKTYETGADLLLLDAKFDAQALPGGNGVSFDWGLLKAISLSKPWMLAGGLTVDLIAKAAEAGARSLDVSSGVEDAPGQKNPEKIRAFLAKAQEIETCY